MAIIDSFTCVIPLDQLENVDDLAFGVLHMDRENVMDQFDDVYEDTRGKCFDTFVCKGIASSFPVEGVSEGEIRIEGGSVLSSPILAQAMEHAEEIVLYAVTVHGYEQLSKNPDNDVFDGMFYDAWGAGFSMSCHRWMKARIAERVRGAGMFLGRGWTPGEDDLEISLQKDLFHIIDPSQIGISLAGGSFMQPVMSVSGFMGISSDSSIEGVGRDAGECH